LEPIASLVSVHR